MASKISTQVVERATIPLDDLLPNYEFPPAEPQALAVIKTSLPSIATLRPERLTVKEKEIQQEEKDNDRSERYSDMVREQHQKLLMEELRLDTLVEFFGKHSPTKHTALEIKELADQEGGQVGTALQAAMTTVLAKQRPLECNIGSLHAFFAEAGCDGSANSVTIVDHHPIDDDFAKDLGESNVMDMELDSDDEHPLWDKAVDEHGKALPVTFRTLDDKNVIQTMTAMIGVGANLRGSKQVLYFGRKAAHASAVVAVNVPPHLCGPKTRNLKRVEKELRRLFTSEEEISKSVVAVANHPIIREASEFEDSPVLVYPGFVLLGKVYFNEKVAGDRSMTCSPINPPRDAIDAEWMKGLYCPYVRDRRKLLNELSIVFLDETSNREGDDVVTHFNSAVSAYAPNRIPFTVVLAENWLRKVVTHHLLQYAGGDNTNEFAQQVALELNLKLAGLSSTKDQAKPFLRAWVAVDESRCEPEIAVDGDDQPILDAHGDPVLTGRIVQRHHVYVEYREGIENFSVRIIRP